MITKEKAKEIKAGDVLHEACHGYALVFAVLARTEDELWVEDRQERCTTTLDVSEVAQANWHLNVPDLDKTVYVPMTKLEAMESGLLDCCQEKGDK